MIKLKALGEYSILISLTTMMLLLFIAIRGSLCNRIVVWHLILIT